MSRSPSPSPTSPWFDPAYSYRKQLTVDHTLVAGSSELTDFPVLVSLTDPALKTVSNGGRVTNGSGYDLIFVDGAGTTRLDHEIESYNASTGQIAMWVRLPALGSATDTAFFLYYGNSNVSTSQENKSSLWTDYEAVYHLNGNFTDSANARNGTNYGSTAATGKMGAARRFTSDYASVPENNALDAQTDFTVTTWVKPASLPTGTHQDILRKSHTHSPWNSWYLSFTNESRITFNVLNSSSSKFEVKSNTAPATNQWYHIAGVKTGSDLSLFVNGSEDEAAAAAFAGTPFNANSKLEFGNITSAYTLRDSNLDEVRIAKGSLSADRIKTEYDNESKQGVGSGEFLKSVGSEETTD